MPFATWLATDVAAFTTFASVRTPRATASPAAAALITSLMSKISAFQVSRWVIPATFGGAVVVNRAMDRPTDLYKFIFQGVMGPGHAVPNAGMAGEWLRRDWEELESVADADTLIWDAPIKNQQQYLILRFGTNVSLGNIPPDDILALEALRNGLRGDTLKRAYLVDKQYKK